MRTFHKKKTNYVLTCDGCGGPSSWEMHQIRRVMVIREVGMPTDEATRMRKLKSHQSAAVAPTESTKRMIRLEANQKMKKRVPRFHGWAWHGVGTRTRRKRTREKTAKTVFVKDMGERIRRGYASLRVFILELASPLYFVDLFLGKS